MVSDIFLVICAVVKYQNLQRQTDLIQTLYRFCAALLPKFSLVPQGGDKLGAFTTDTAQGMGGPVGELPEIQKVTPIAYVVGLGKVCQATKAAHYGLQ